MNKETKQQLKADAARSAKAAAGAAVGATIAGALGGQEAAAAEIPTDDDVEIVHPETEHQQPQPANPQHQTAPQTVRHDTNAPEPEVETRSEVEVLGYERTVTADGNPMDLAVVSVDGQEIAFLDADLDGRADLMLCDTNGDGNIDDSEMVNIQAEGIDMQPLQVAAQFNPLYADNTLPDYVNDGTADTLLA